MNVETKNRIKGFLGEFIDGIINSFTSIAAEPRKLRPRVSGSLEGKLKPFHEAMLPHGLLTISEFERSFSSRLGTTFEEAARLIALEQFADAKRGYEIAGAISQTSAEEIDRLVEGASPGYIRGRFMQIVDQVLSARTGEVLQATTIADLWVVDDEGKETFFEIKSPKPNKGQCLEATRRLLHIHAIRGTGPPLVRTFYAMPYNPWGETRESYAHSFANNYLDMEQQVLIGHEFWEYIGGPGTYEALLDVYREVGQELGSEMFDRLGLGY